MLCRRMSPPLLAALLLAAACSSDDTAGAERTATTSSSTTTTAPPDLYAVPAEIDTGYVSLVMNELLRVLSEAVRIAMREGEVTPEVEAMHVAVYGPDRAPSVNQGLRDQAAAGFPGMREAPGDSRVSIENIREIETGCVVAEGALDLVDVQDTPTDPGPMVFSLRSAPRTTDDNPTGWVIQIMTTRNLYQPEKGGCTAS